MVAGAVVVAAGAGVVVAAGAAPVVGVVVVAVPSVGAAGAVAGAAGSVVVVAAGASGAFSAGGAAGVQAATLKAKAAAITVAMASLVFVIVYTPRPGDQVIRRAGYLETFDGVCKHPDHESAKIAVSFTARVALTLLTSRLGCGSV